MAGLAVVALAAALVPAVAAQAAVTPAAGIQVKLAHSNKCLNVAGASTANNAKIVQYGCVSTATNDKFKLVPKGNDNYWIQALGSGKCLNVAGNSTANGAAIVQYTCGTQLNTLWQVDEVLEKSTYRFVSASSGRCLNIPNASTADNVALIQYACTNLENAPNEQFYLPPTSSAAVVHRPFTAEQPVSVVQGVPATAGATAPVYYSYINADNALVMLTERNPDPYNTDPNAPESAYYFTFDYGYTGRTQSAKLQDGRVQVTAHDAAAGDLVLADERVKGTGEFGDIWDIGGAFAGPQTVGPIATDGSLATFTVIGGALWYAPQSVNNTQTPYGAWRSLGGSGLTGTPVSIPTATGARIFALNTAGQVVVANFAGGVLQDWENIGGTGLNGSLSVVKINSNLVAVFARSADGTIVTARQNLTGTLPPVWSPIAGLQAAGSPTAVLNEYPGQVAVSVRGSDGLIYFAYETAPGSGQYSDWIVVSDPEEHPETVAASDPTAFSYDVPSGSSFGIAFQSVDDVDLPVVITFDSVEPVAGKAKVAAKNAVPHAKVHKMKPAKKTVKLK